MCTQAKVRSHLLAPGETTEVLVTFTTAVDGPGAHGETVRVVTEPVLASGTTSISFLIQVDPARA